MKSYFALLVFLITTSIALGQNKEKMKGSKTVTIEQKEIGNFETLEVSDNIEVYLDRGEKSELKIEADDNLHEIIRIDLSANMLTITTSKKATNYKKLIVRVTYTKDLKMIVSKNEAIINAIQEIQLNDISVKAQDESRLFLNVNSKNFTFQAEHDSETELNLKSETASIEMSDKASLKALIASNELKCDLYQKSIATLEGQTTNAQIRLDNNAEFIGKNLLIANATLKAESYSKSSLTITTGIEIDAAGNSGIELYGDQKIEMKRFVDNAVLSKKPTK